MMKLVESLNGKPLAKWEEHYVKKFWDFTSKDENIYFAAVHADEIIKQSRNYLDSKIAILDFGAGPGHLTRQLISKGFSVTAFETSHETVETLKKRFESSPNFHGVIQPNQVITSQSRFDVIFILEVIEHLSDDQLAIMLDRLKILLKNNGHIIMSTPNNENLFESLVYCPFSDVVFHRWQHVRSWNSTTLKAWLKKNNFQVKDMRETNFTRRPNIWPLTRKSIGQNLGYLKEKIERKRPHLFCIAQLSN